MPPSLRVKTNRPVPAGKTGILLVNLGTPESPGFWDIRRYLSEFLSDPRVIETPRILWWPALNFVILNTRPGRAAKQYAKIWNKETGEGPLKAITRSQAGKLAAWVRAGGLDPKAKSAAAERFFIAWAMRYGRPNIGDGITALKDRGCARILVLPLYPQYAAATSASVTDKVFDNLRQMRWQPTVRIAAPYFDDPIYIDLLAASVRAELARLKFVPDHILVSFHGLPKAAVAKGDPYYAQCLETWRLLREELRLTGEQCPLTFQSRFGRAEWLQPYTVEEIKRLAARGAKSLALVTPGFSADCLETLYEIGIECREIFLAHGGENFAVIPCLNDSEFGMMLIGELVSRELQGWI